MTELIQIEPAPANKGFCCFEGIPHPLARCFYSIAGGFKTDLIFACRELEVAILYSMVESDQFPRHMVEGGTQIVDSVADYRCERAGQFCDKADANTKTASGGVGLDVEPMGPLTDEIRELPFEIGNVIVSPFEFLFGAIEHA